jgi:hypothetical protein
VEVRAVKTILYVDVYVRINEPWMRGWARARGMLYRDAKIYLARRLKGSCAYWSNLLRAECAAKSTGTSGVIVRTHVQSPRDAGRPADARPFEVSIKTHQSVPSSRYKGRRELRLDWPRGFPGRELGRYVDKLVNSVLDEED